jgi:hypothetical protein
MTTPCITPSHRVPRSAERVALTVPARLMWKDKRGASRFAMVVTRNVSEYGVLVECPTAFSIDLFRLVHLQLDRETRDNAALPPSLREGRVLSAVYRVSPATRSGVRQCLALRLMVDPKRRPAAFQPDRATA